MSEDIYCNRAIDRSIKGTDDHLTRLIIPAIVTDPFNSSSLLLIPLALDLNEQWYVRGHSIVNRSMIDLCHQHIFVVYRMNRIDI